MIRFLLACLAMLILAAPVVAETRLALVIGNADYRVAPLANPGNDARLIAAAFQESGFDARMLVNADRRAITDAVREFANRLKSEGPDAVGAFYFAGHGVQVDGRNFLIPVNARIDGAADLEFEAVEAQWILNRIGESGVGLSLFILDACRNNPFKSVNRAGTRGLARMDAPRGSLLSYSTAPGDAALDGDGANSPYSAALANAIRTPGLKVEDVFKATRREVLETTGGRQTPWESSSLLGDFYFTPGDAPTLVFAPSAATYAPGETFSDCRDCPEMVALGGGDALIGAKPGEAGAEHHESPNARVALRPFALARREVTRADYARFLNETGRKPDSGCWYLFGVWVYDPGLSWRDTGYDQSDDHPVACVRWSDAAAYADWLSSKTGQRYRLPSEAEWEYAARPSPWGGDASAACRFGNVHDEAANEAFASGLVHAVAPCRDGVAATASVGSFPADGRKLFDMIGNLSEWTADCWNSGHSGRPADGAARRDGDCGHRVVKGASFLSPAHANRPAWRLRAVARDANIYLGFRVARDLR